MIIRIKNYDLKDFDDIQIINIFFNERSNIISLLDKFLLEDLDDDDFFKMVVGTYKIIFINDDIRNLNNKKVRILPHKLKYLNDNISDIKDINYHLYESILKIFRRTFHRNRISKDVLKIKKEYKKEITYLRNKAIKNKEKAEKELEKNKKIIEKCNNQVKKIKNR